MMQNLSHIEVSEICNQLGKETPKNIKRIYGGNIHASWQIKFLNTTFFLKKNTRNKRFLKFEKYCLSNLRENMHGDNLIIPEIISYWEINNSEYLLMEWIDMGKGDQKRLGKGLAEIHLKSNSSSPNKFGYPIEGYIGTTVQTKGWEDNWVDCFINLRIEPQLSILKNDFLDIKIKKQIIEKIKLELNTHKPFNTLVHGDLWSGNIGINNDGKGVIFDPACWWADSEVDIAMTRLFGGFEKEFYDEYNKIIPLQKGNEKRIIIYNFYHILNHANMFGGGYLKQVKDYIKEILNM